LAKEISLLKENKLQLLREIAPWNRQLEAAKRAKEKPDDQVEVQKAKVEDLKAKVK
jgi:hypothetical protein